MEVTGITAMSAQTANSGTAQGQTITKNSGSIAVALDASSPVTALVKAASTLEVASYKWTTTNDAYTLKEVVITVNDATAVNQVVLMDGTDELGTAYVVSGDATFAGLNLPIDANTSKKLTVKYILGDVGTSAGTSGADIKATLKSYKADNSQGVETSATPGTAANSLYVVKAVPTIANVALPSTILNAGTQTLAKFSVTGDGTIGWKYFKFDIVKSDAVTLASYKVYDANTNDEVTGSTTASTTLGSVGFINFEATTEQEISGSKTYVLKATVGGTVTTNDYVSTSVAAPSSNASPVAFGAVPQTSSFIWTDQNQNGHSVSTTDWFNDFKVKNLATDAQTLTK
jgi:hypothetical protein